jgi:hypothetical protein
MNLRQFKISFKIENKAGKVFFRHIRRFPDLEKTTVLWEPELNRPFVGECYGTPFEIFNISRRINRVPLLYREFVGVRFIRRHSDSFRNETN